MDRTAIFVDAGYLFASGSKLLTGDRQTRSHVHLDHEAVLALLSELARQLTALPLLRIYWYDGASGGANPAQVALSYRPSLKLRLGLVNAQGQQEGVDQLIARDLTGLAQNRAIAEALLLTGDDDLRGAVELAQSSACACTCSASRPRAKTRPPHWCKPPTVYAQLSEAEVRQFMARRAP